MKSKEEIAKGEAQLTAEETALKRRWCALKGHRWDLPGVSPFNNDLLECEVICNRCNVHASVVVTVHAYSDAPAVPEPAKK